MIHSSVRSLGGVAALYMDDAARHRQIFDAFTVAMQHTGDLWQHRQHVEHERLGFGERAFHWLWKLIVDVMPQRFKFLEIGVYKGQVTSLVGMLALRTGRDGYVYGVSPLEPLGDQYSVYDAVDYRETISQLEAWCDIPLTRRARIIDGRSNDPEVKEICRSLGPFDCIYIDGCHDYNMVAHDIVVYSELVVPGGFLAMDDAASELKLPPGIFPGHPDVGRAVREILQPDCRFDEILSVGHVRLWRKQGGAALSALVPDPAGVRENIALNRPALQSSTSEWSNNSDPTADAAGGNNGFVTGLYGFHTAEEIEPWWRVDLGKPTSFSEAVIYNRLDAASAAARAAHLRISVSVDALSWSEVYARNESEPFGGADGHPLRIALPGSPARYVRVSLPGRAILHLDEFELY